MKGALVQKLAVFSLSPLLIMFTLLGSVRAKAQASAGPRKHFSARFPVYPVKVSANGRYLVDQNNIPFLIAGDSPQAMIYRLSEAQVESYFADREAHGFNTAGWVDVVCAGRDYPSNIYGATYDGIRPFTGFVRGGSDWRYYNLRKPNEAYFIRLDHIVELAAKHHILVFLDPAETAGWLLTLRNNGLAADYAYGRFLGNRYKRFPTIAWINGNDFSGWKDSSNDAVVQAVARGIKSADPGHIQTIEFNPPTGASLDDPAWARMVSINGAYVYGPTYIQMLHNYNQKPGIPAFLMEAHYELENVGGVPDFGTPSVLRREEYWTMLSGGKGQFYGNRYTWSFANGWQSHLDTPGVAQFTIWKSFFDALPWWNLVPDQTHAVVTAGLGTYGNSQTRVSQSDFCTAAGTPDGSLIVAYMPTARTITVNMKSLRAPALAKWFDPTNGTYTAIPGGPFVDAGTRRFTPPGKNSQGDSDWVLLLDGSHSARR
ncbi:MAG TPA: DUF4038 domain-containing protein [Terriglobia bacterium]|nr:DUF4038 domain-containing protein [Terriglobia bacterium]